MTQLMQRFGSIATFVALLLKDNPALKVFEARLKARGTKRIRINKFKPHYGIQAAERNRRHAEAGTHGLKMVDRCILFS